ncbi:unnamed protein product [Parascedosporium putredinis]|uniref:Target of rapamycin complex subunit LST8 n=1 Tax=Parascedosporium putredinis TaxID=1442378 RepID=A0A9P1H4F1_9PEZI|nr:unnamed protein product [Parascedosporium putredinis]CAI7995961.1 unnamed protein product [Parascedosporium putredinis]
MSVILCTAGYDHTIRFWEALSGICSRTIQHPESQVNRLCITPDKRFLAAAGHHTVKLYDIKSTNPNAVLTFEGHMGNVTGVAFHCEGKWMVTSSEDGTVKIWETRSGTVQRTYHHASAVNDVVIHPNQGEIISCDRGGSGNVFIWKLAQSLERTNILPLAQFNAHKEYITRVLLSPDVKKLATCSADHTAKIWEVRDLEPGQMDQLPPNPYPLEATLTGHQRWVWDCAFSADSAYLVTACSDHYARLWELSTQTIIRQYNGHHRGAVCVALNDYSEASGGSDSIDDEDSDPTPRAEQTGAERSQAQGFPLPTQEDDDITPGPRSFHTTQRLCKMPVPIEAHP